MNCCLGECKECGIKSDIETLLLDIFSDLDIEEITYKQWESTDRTTLTTIVQPTQEFVECLIKKLLVLSNHQFIHRMQSKFFYNMKENLFPGQVLVVGDFSENYSFMYQDAAQGVHWSNSSCTLHTWVWYYMEGNALKTFNCLMISDHLEHNTVAVYSFQKKLIYLFKNRHDLRIVQYFLDGCSHQNKNKKNFLNLVHHELDFNVPADRGFSATSNGKGPWDGLAGCDEQEATIESLWHPLENQI